MSESRAPRARLKVARSTGETWTYTLEKAKAFTIGRRSDNELQVNDRHVSRYHAVLEAVEQGWVLRDLGSKQGTFVNGRPPVDSILRDGDVITLGQSESLRLIYLESPSQDSFTRAMESEPSIEQEDTHDLMMLLQVSKALNSTLVLSDVLNLLMDSVLQVASAERGFLMLSDKSGELRFKIARNMNKETLEGSGFQISRSVVERVVETGQPEILVNVEDDPRFRNQESILALELKTILCVPLILQRPEEHRMLGVIYVDNKSLTQSVSKKGLRLLETLASHASVAIENARLHQEALEKRRIEEELKLARAIQQGLLPRETPELPYVEVCALSNPSRAVGGDYYNYTRCDDGRFVFLIGDVSGKGVPAALLMSLLDGIFSAHTELQANENVEETVSRFNNYIFRKSSAEKFITLFYGVLSEDGTVTYTNAGHNPPLLFSPDGEVSMLREGGPLLGAFPDMLYSEGTVRLRHLDTLLLFTDGITEGRNPQKEEFGEERLIEVVRKNLDCSPIELQSIIEDAVAEFARGEPQHDDMTLLILQYRDPAQS